MSFTERFEWCTVRDVAKDHACFISTPNHAVHVCCCGVVLQEGPE